MLPDGLLLSIIVGHELLPWFDMCRHLVGNSILSPALVLQHMTSAQLPMAMLVQAQQQVQQPLRMGIHPAARNNRMGSSNRSSSSNTHATATSHHNSNSGSWCTQVRA